MGWRDFQEAPHCDFMDNMVFMPEPTPLNPYYPYYHTVPVSENGGAPELPIQSDTFQGVAEIITPEGERVWIATDLGSVKLIPEGAVFFLGDEIMQLQKAGKEAARAALMIKQVFPGAGPVSIGPINSVT